MKNAGAAASAGAKYNGLDGIRAYSAIGILVMHVLANGGYADVSQPLRTVISRLVNLVFLFMMVSAFSLCCGYYQSVRDGRLDVDRFYRRRFERIWPAFVLLCLAEFAVSPGTQTLYETLMNATMFFGFLPNNNITVIGVGWFLGVVFIFYMIFPFFCWLVKSRGRAWLTFAAALMIHYLCRVYFFDVSHVAEGFDSKHNFLFCAVYFAAGALIYLYRDTLAALGRKYRWLLLVLCAAGAAAVCTPLYGTPADTPLLLVLFTLMVTCAIGSGGRLLANPVTKFLSGISMEIYLCHMLVFNVIRRLGLSQPAGSGTLSFVLVSVMTLAVSIAAAFVLNRGIAALAGWIGRKRETNTD